MIGEVISVKNESDRYRMLLQAIVAARVGRYVRKDGTPKGFILLALYLTRTLTVERYLVCQCAEDSQVRP